MRSHHLSLSLVLSLLSGALLGFAFVFPSLGWFSWVAFVPLFAVLENEDTTRDRWLFVFLAFQMCYVVAGYWVLKHSIATAAMASIGGFVTMPLVHSFPIVMAKGMERRFGAGIGAVALLAFYSAFESALANGQWGIPWLILGHSQGSLYLTNQIADLVGTPGLGWWILGINLCVWKVVKTGSTSTRSVPLVLVFSLVLLPFLYSVTRTNTYHDPSRFLTAKIVQPGIHPEVWTTWSNAKRIDHLKEVAGDSEADTSIELVVWPETSLHITKADTGWLDSVPVDSGKTLVFGAVVEEHSDSAGPVLYNAMIRVDANDTRRYDKYRLVPFAESVPYSDIFPWLSRFAVPAGGVRGYERGTGPHLLPTENASIGPLICFESAFSSLSSSLVRKGADFLLVISQDGWWNDDLPARQHVSVAQIRAIETRRAVLHVASTGISALVYPDGNVAASTSWMSRESLILEVPVSDNFSIYPRFATFSSLIGPIVSVFLMFMWFFRRPQTSRVQKQK